MASRPPVVQFVEQIALALHHGEPLPDGTSEYLEKVRLDIEQRYDGWEETQDDSTDLRPRMMEAFEQLYTAIENLQECLASPDQQLLEEAVTAAHQLEETLGKIEAELAQPDPSSGTYLC